MKPLSCPKHPNAPIRHSYDLTQTVLNGMPSGTGVKSNHTYECAECSLELGRVHELGFRPQASDVDNYAAAKLAGKLSPEIVEACEIYRTALKKGDAGAEQSRLHSVFFFFNGFDTHTSAIVTMVNDYIAGKRGLNCCFGKQGDPPGNPLECDMR